MIRPPDRGIPSTSELGYAVFARRGQLRKLIEGVFGGTEKMELQHCVWSSI